MVEVIEQAIAAGKFSESRRLHYERMYARDPEGTTALIARLEAVPLLPAPPEGVSPLFGGRAMALEFADTMVTQEGARAALSTYPMTADPAKVKPLFEVRRDSKRVTFG